MAGDEDCAKLAAGEVHIWLTFPKEISDRRLLDAYHGLMNPTEAAQQRRFHFEKDRHSYLVTRAMVRTLLSRYAPVQPRDWVFEKNEYGRPFLAPAHRLSDLRFNISHTDGLIAIAVVQGREVGVDVETVERGGELVKIADRFFAPTEVAALNQVPPEGQTLRFFDYWTLKESYIKARGMGLSIPLDQFAFDLDDGPEVRINIDESLADPPDRWQFRHWWVDPRYKVALTLERAPLDSPVVLHRLVPLAQSQTIACRQLRISPDWR